MARKEERLQKAHDLADSAKKIVGILPLSTIVASNIDMAEWSDKTMLDKACEWLKTALTDDAYVYPYGGVDYETLIKDFRKAMEE